MVTVQVHLFCACQLDEIAAPFQFLLLTLGQGVSTIAIINHKVIRLERYTACGKISLANVGNASVHIEVPVPCSIHAPIHLVCLTISIHVKEDVHVCLLAGLHEVCCCLCLKSQHPKWQSHE